MFLLGRIPDAWLRGRRVSGGALALAGVLVVAAGLSLGTGSADAAPASGDEPSAGSGGGNPRRYLKGFDPTALQTVDGHVESSLPNGRTARLTMDAGLQRHVQRMLDRYQVPYAGVVAMKPSDGRLLAYVSHSQSHDGRDYVRDASPPAASVFKLVTSAALIERGLGPDTRTCYNGGFSRLTARNLLDSPRDKACVSLTTALARSVNSVFAKLAVRHVGRDRLQRYADAFGFGQAPPFDAPTQTSASAVGSGELGLARTAAGFWNMHMSPLHAVTIASTIANRGRMMRPIAVESVTNGAGNVVYEAEPRLHRAVLERRTADLIGRMMRSTVTRGTARKSFYDSQGNAFLPGISVAGKTGTLSKERPYRGYTWWVGFAPADKPEIALAALVVNSPKWRIKASYAAREALRYYLVERPRVERKRRRAEAERAARQAASKQASAEATPPTPAGR